MYGTIARLQLKPGMEQKLKEFASAADGRRQIPGYIGSRVFRMDSDPNEFYLVVAFENKEAYEANANSPDQDAEYRHMLEMLASEPEWHDGEIVYNS